MVAGGRSMAEWFRGALACEKGGTQRKAERAGLAQDAWGLCPLVVSSISRLCFSFPPFSLPLLTISHRLFYPSLLKLFQIISPLFFEN